MWYEWNPNPETKHYTRGRNKGKKLLHGDCVVRAFTVLFDMTWEDTYMKLAQRGLECFDVFDRQDVYQTFLERVKIDLKVPVRKTGDPRKHRKMTVKEIAKLTKDNDKVYLCHTLHHVVVCKDGLYWDSWNSGKEPVRSLWKLKEEYQRKLRNS